MSNIRKHTSWITPLALAILLAPATSYSDSTALPTALKVISVESYERIPFNELISGKRFETELTVSVKGDTCVLRGEFHALSDTSSLAFTALDSKCGAQAGEPSRIIVPIELNWEEAGANALAYVLTSYFYLSY